MTMRTRRKRTLQRILAVRALIVSLSACVALTGFFLLHYLLNTPTLRQLTLENEVRTIADLSTVATRPAGDSSGTSQTPTRSGCSTTAPRNVASWSPRQMWRCCRRWRRPRATQVTPA